MNNCWYIILVKKLKFVFVFGNKIYKIVFWLLIEFNVNVFFDINCLIFGMLNGVRCIFKLIKIFFVVFLVDNLKILYCVIVKFCGFFCFNFWNNIFNGLIKLGIFFLILVNWINLIIFFNVWFFFMIFWIK